MTNNLQVISDNLRDKQVLKRLALALNLDFDNEVDKKTIQKYASSVLMEVEKSTADSKKDLTECTPQSIVQCMIDAAGFKITIDGRQHAHIIRYGKNATLQIGYRGFIAKIREAVPSSDINVFPVYEGDDLALSSKDGYDYYAHSRGNPFASEKDLTGVVGVLYYKKGDKEFQRVLPVSIADIQKIKGCAKQSFIWDKWFVEKAKVAVIKRLCKMTFAEISDIQDIAEYDNKNNFTIEDSKPVINEDAQSDEFTQKALEQKALPEEGGAVMDAVEFDPTYGGQYDPNTGEVLLNNEGE